MDGCGGGCVSMNKYWNWIATPYFIFILVFCLFVLFEASTVQILGTASLFSIIDSMVSPAEKEAAKPKPTAPPPPPAPPPVGTAADALKKRLAAVRGQANPPVGTAADDLQKRLAAVRGQRKGAAEGTPPPPPTEPSNSIRRTGNPKTGNPGNPRNPRKSPLAAAGLAAVNPKPPS